MRALRIVDDVARPASGADNMAADRALLDAVRADGRPALRLYTWAGPTLSLGRFQPDTDVDRGACERLGVEVVRRPTGGKALLHGSDLTYAVALVEPPGRGTSIDAMYRTIARPLIAALASLGVDAAVARHEGPGGAVCFATQQGADLRVGERKVCGSAQVRRDGLVLQHGSILLDRLTVDETDVVVDAPPRDALLAATVTLRELGAPSDPRSVADALALAFS